MLAHFAYTLNHPDAFGATFEEIRETGLGEGLTVPALEAMREDLAHTHGCGPNDVIFTSITRLDYPNTDPMHLLADLLARAGQTLKDSTR